MSGKKLFSDNCGKVFYEIDRKRPRGMIKQGVDFVAMGLKNMVSKIQKRKREQKPLAMDERFVTKKEFNNFKDIGLTNFDKILKKLDILLTEKKVVFL